MVDVIKVIDELIDDTKRNMIQWHKKYDLKSLDTNNFVADTYNKLGFNLELEKDGRNLLFRNMENTYSIFQITNDSDRYELIPKLVELYKVASTRLDTANLEKLLNKYVEEKELFHKSGLK